jgi:hypothetical protein
MNNEEMLSTYEVIAKITDQMRQSTKVEDWNRLFELEQLCVRYSEKSYTWKESEPLSKKDNERKIKSLKIIIKNDKEIRDYLEPWQKKLNELMSNSQEINADSTF